jgi:hypothetical protein
MNQEDYIYNPLWHILMETVHAMIMYPHHKAYVRDVYLKEKPDLTAKLLATKMGIPLGEALVIFHEIAEERPQFKSPEHLKL